MASFTDIIPQFNPYIQQLPVEAMVQVGLEKQKRYDEGIQKIQTQIDSYAGLDIYKDADRAYLQSKLNELGNNLKGVAAGDFSNFQLVTSVSGMTNQIIKDRNIQNAISSTQKIRKEQAFMDEDRKKGNLHINNERDFNKQIQRYVNNNNVGEVFSGRYQPYTDYQKKWIEVQKGLGIKETQTDLPFVMQNGKVVLDDKGKPIVNDYMVRETFKGIDPQRLKEAIMASMNDNDYNQMRIDADASYEGYTPDRLMEEAHTRYVNDRSQLEKTIKSLNILKNQYVGDNDMTSKIDAQINSYLARITDEDEQFKSTVQGIQSNPEGYKTKLFTMNSINNFANSFSNMSHIQNVVTNPIRQQMNEDRNYNFRVIEFNTKNEQWKKDFGLRESAEARLANKAAFDQAIELYKLGLGPNPLGPSAPKYVGAPPTDKDVLDGMLESFKQGADIDRLNQDKNQLKVNWARNQSTKSDIEKQLGRKPGSMTDAEYKSFLDEQFNNDLAAYNRDRNSIKSPATRKILDQYSELDKLYKLKVNTVNDAMRAADEKNPEVSQEINKLPTNKVQFLQYTSRDGKPGVYPLFSKSAREVYDDIQAGRASLRVDRAPGGDISLYYPQENINYTIPKKGGFFGSDVVSAKDVRPLLMAVSEAFNKVGTSIKKRDADYAKILGEKINSLAPIASNLPKGAMTTLLPMIEEKFGREQKGETEEVTGFVKGKDFNMSTIRSLAVASDVKPMYTTWGDNVFITVTGKVGKNVETQKFKISRDEFNRTFPAFAETTDIDFLQSAAANGSTNYNYPIANTALKNKEDAFVSASYTIPSSKYIVKGDIFFDQNDKNNALPVIWVKSKKTGSVLAIPSNEYSTFTGADKAMSQINDLTIENYLKNNKLNADF